VTSLAVETIADRVRDRDVADFMRFRAVCKLWMAGSSTQKPRELGEHVIDHRFHPRRWILLTEPPAPEDTPTPTRRKLLNVTTREIIKVHLPELAGHAVIPGPAAAPEGMLVVCEMTTLVVRLLNPLTRHVVDLPSLQTLQTADRHWGPIPFAFRVNHVVTAAGFADASTVVVYFGRINQMAMVKPGDALWTPVGGLNPEFPLRSTATFQCRFYCVDRTNLMVLDLDQRQLVVAADMVQQFRTVSLVDDSGRLMAVCSLEQVVRFGARSSLTETQIELFHVDLEKGTLLPILDLGERAIFTGPRGAVLLPRTNYYFSVDRGTVFFRFCKSHQPHFGAFHVHSRHTCYVASTWRRLGEHVASYATAGIK
jgi:hypothetical protein